MKKFNLHEELCFACLGRTWREGIAMARRRLSPFLLRSIVVIAIFSRQCSGEDVQHCQSDQTRCSGATAGISDSGQTSYETFEDIPEEMVKRGHMKELGSHRDPDGGVEVLPYMISSEDFYERYVSRHKPVVIRNVGKHWPATKLWTDEYLREKYGNISMNMETRDDDKWNIPPGRTMSSFLNIYKTANLYMVDEVPPGMREEIVMPLCLRCNEIADRFFVSYYWMSNGGTASKLHIDTDENLLTVIQGSKDIVLISPKYSRHLYADEARLIGVSEVNVSAVDLKKYPRIANMRYLTAHLGPGDSLYLPQMWWHYVYSGRMRQQAVAMWWKSIPFQKGFAKKSASTSRKRTDEERKAEPRATSFARWLEEYILWIEDIAKDADTRPACPNQVEMMIDYPFETDKEEWRNELTRGRLQTDQPSEDLKKIVDGPLRKRRKPKVMTNADGETFSPSEPEITHFCYFDVDNPESPCNHPVCGGHAVMQGHDDKDDEAEGESEDNEDEEEDPSAEFFCIRYMLDYCDKFEDRGCVIELPQHLNKKSADEIEHLEALRGKKLPVRGN